MPTKISTVPLFSVVIPVHNRAEKVIRAINSVRNQSLQDFEIIVTDDGSTDATAAGIRAIRDPRIRLLEQSQLGASAARNAGAELASAEFLTFLDSDDTAEIDWLETLANLLSQPGVYLASCAVRHVTQTGREIRVVVPGPLQGYLHDSHVLVSHGGSYALRTDLFRQVGGFDALLAAGEHTELGYRLLNRLADAPGSIVETTRPLLNYHVGSPDGLRGDSDAVIAGTLRILEVHHQRLNKAAQATAWAVVAYRSMHLGKRSEARRGALRAVQTNPRAARHWGRALAYLLTPARLLSSRTARRHRFYISLQSQYFNCGDVELLRRLVEHLLARGDLIVRVDGVPESIVQTILPRTHGHITTVDGSLVLRAILGSFRSRLTRNSNRRDVLWLKPGHATVTGTTMRNLFLGVAFRLITALGGHVVRIGISLSIDEHRGLGSRFFYRSFSIVGVRDSESQERVASLTGRTPLITPDLSVVGRASLAPVPRGKASPDGSGHSVSLSFRDVIRFHPHFELEPGGVVGTLAEASRAVVETFRAEPVNYAQVRGDHEFTAQVVEAAGFRAVRTVVADPESGGLDRAFRHLADTDVVVSNRLHVVLFAMLSACLPIALIDPSCQPKISTYLGDAGLQDLIIDLRGTPDDQRRHIRDIQRNYASLLERCSSYLVHAEKDWSRVVDGLDYSLRLQQ